MPRAAPAIAACALLLAACSGNEKKTDSASSAGLSPPEPSGAATSGTSGEPAPPRKRELRVATYNAGLAVGVLKYADERADPLIEELAGQPLDLLCVQEMWLDEHWHKLVARTATTLPNTVRMPAEVARGTCDPAEVAPLVACAEASCAGAAVHEAPMCLLRSCSGALTGLSAGCFECLAEKPRDRPEALARACTSPSANGKGGAGKKGVSGEGGGAPGFRVYGGSTGTGLLTSLPILEQDVKVLPSSLDRRAVLHARIAAPMGPLDVFCTHLTADLSGVPHPGKASWERDQAAQIDQMLAFIDEKTRGRPALLLGDLNTGPALGRAISASLPDHYARLLDHGFSNPYAGQPDAGCTYCFDNPLDGGRGTRGLLIDHVLLRGFSGSAARAERFMREPVTLSPGGEPIRLGPSDHFGVSLTLVAGG